MVAQIVKNLPAIQDTWFWPRVRKIPWRRECQPTPVFLPGEFHGQRSLVGYGSWGCEESDMTEWLTLLTLCVSFQKVWVWGVIINYYLPVRADSVFDLIHEVQTRGSRISLSVSRGHTLCLDRKSLYFKIPCRMAPAATERKTVFLLLEVLLWLCASYQY